MRIIGSGTFAQVYLQDNHAVKRTRMECPEWSKLPSHPNILRLVKVHKQNGLFYYHSKHLANGDLYRLLEETGQLPPNAALYLTLGIAKGLQTMHLAGYGHRDVKLENVLVGDQDFTPVLCDFDFTVLVGNEPNGTWKRCGSVPYCAPEVLSNTPHDPRVADCWSLGVCLYAMLAGRLPFDGKTNAENGNGHISKRIIAGEYEIPQSLDDDLCINLIHGLLERDPTKRMSMDDIVSCIEKRQLNQKECVAIIERLRGPVGFDMAPPPPQLLYMHGNISASEFCFQEIDDNNNTKDSYTAIPMR